MIHNKVRVDVRKEACFSGWAQILPNETPQKGKMQFAVLMDLECHKPGQHSKFLSGIAISNQLGVASP